MKSQVKWLLIIILLVLVVIIFPKECGSKYSEIVELSNLNYKCLGTNGPDLSRFSKSNSSYNWCYGICLKQSRNDSSSKNNDNSYEGPGMLSGFASSFTDLFKPLILIGIIIALILTIQKFQAKEKQNQVTVIKQGT